MPAARAPCRTDLLHVATASCFIDILKFLFVPASGSSTYLSTLRIKVNSVAVFLHTSLV